MSEKINPSDIVVTTKECKFGSDRIPKGKYFVVKRRAVGKITKEDIYHVENCTKLLTGDEVVLAKTFALNDIVKFKNTKTFYNNGVTWRVVKVYVNKKNELLYDIETTKPGVDKQTVGKYDIVGVNVVGNIEVGDRILILKNEHRYKIYTVEKSYRNTEMLFYAVKEIDISFMETDVRIWEEKDGRIRDNLYKISKLLRDNELALETFPTRFETQLDVVRKDRENLQKYYDEFMDKRIFLRETIKKVNNMYIGNLTIEKLIVDTKAEFGEKNV